MSVELRSQATLSMVAHRAVVVGVFLRSFQVGGVISPGLLKGAGFLRRDWVSGYGGFCPSEGK